MEALFKAATSGSHDLSYDEFDGLARKCAWALADIGTDDARQCLEELSRSPNQAIARYATQRLSVAGRARSKGARAKQMTNSPEHGASVFALDSSAEMLARLNAKLDSLEPRHRDRIATVHADMQSFDIDERFGLVIAPFRVFLHNLTEEAQAGCTARVFEHLRPGGIFSLNVFHPSLTFMAKHSGDLAGTWRLVGDWTLDDGTFLLRSETSSYDTVQKLVHSRHRFERSDASGRLMAVFLQRLEFAYLFPQDLKLLLRNAGFVDVELFGGFDGRPLADDLDEIVVTARRP